MKVSTEEGLKKLRYDYAVVATQKSYNVEPRDLQLLPAPPVPGSFREVGDDEFGLLVELYRADLVIDVCKPCTVENVMFNVFLRLFVILF